MAHSYLTFSTSHLKNKLSSINGKQKEDVLIHEILSKENDNQAA